MTMLKLIGTQIFADKGFRLKLPPHLFLPPANGGEGGRKRVFQEVLGYNLGSTGVGKRFSDRRIKFEC
jgi:hypothetical protein